VGLQRLSGSICTLLRSSSDPQPVDEAEHSEAVAEASRVRRETSWVRSIPIMVMS
jgi:hypothetical protein